MSGFKCTIVAGQEAMSQQGGIAASIQPIWMVSE